MPKWNRRRFLKAAGLTATGAALLPFFPVPRAEAQTGPKRLVLVTSGQGSDMTRWRPTGTETEFELGYILEPLEPHKSGLIIADGVDNEAAFHGQAGGHFGMCTLWTGVICPEGTVREEGVGWPNAPSVDRIIADRIGQDSSFDAFHWGTWPAAVDGGNQGPNGLAYYSAPQTPVEPVLTPDRAFDRMFAGVAGGEARVAKLRAERQSVIDLVRGEIGRVRRQLPTADHDRLDAHLDGISDIESRLVEISSSCVIPQRPRDFTESEGRNFTNHPEITTLQFQLMAAALACDLTRVACFQWPHSEGQGSFMQDEGYDSFGSFHAVAHQMSYAEVNGMPVTGDERVLARQNMANLNRWRAQKVSEFLSMIPDDVRATTTLAWASEMSEGGTHSNRNIPLVLYQGEELSFFRTGRYLRWGSWDPLAPSGANAPHGGKSMSQVLVSLCHAMGLEDINSVGDPAWGTGPLEDLS